MALSAAQKSTGPGYSIRRLGNLYIADRYNNRIRKVSGGIITTIVKRIHLVLRRWRPATGAQFNSLTGSRSTPGTCISRQPELPDPADHCRRRNLHRCGQ